ncbi:MAG TPA: ABC transporter permease [Dehalococcoidales bacterium]|nr:ABC transporter permease [Dehalococcoidales bacterium]
MRVLFKLTWVEIKLFIREPITMVFTFALPLIFLFVMGGVFGNTPDPEGLIFRGVGPIDYYVPAYIGLISASIGVVALPVHLTGYRERRVLRRFRASSISIWAVFGSQVVVSLAISILGALLLIAAALVAYDASLPESPGLVVAAFVLSVLSFAAVGVFLGAILPTTRAAQGLGLILFFVMMILSGAGPPREVMTEAMHWIADATPLRYVILTLQDPWLGFGWNVHASLVVGGFLVAATLLSARFFRWE